MNKTAKKVLWMALPAMIGVSLLAGTFWTQSDAHAQGAAGGDAVIVGTYEPQAVFEGYHGREALMQQMQQIEQRMQQAEDQQQMMQLQQEAQQLQNQALQQFEQEVQQAIPEVAEDQNVQLVAVGIVYTADNVQEQNLTQPLLEKVNDNANGGGAQQQQPAQPPLQDFN